MKSSAILTCVLLPALAAAPGVAAEPAVRPPNIVFILADDLGYGDLPCYNKASKIPTPNLDRLAAQGMRFTDAHTPSSVCTPTRYGILTGRYCWRTSLKSGVLNGYSPLLIEPKRLTVASLLKRHGYVTAGFGKWHLGLGDGAKTDFNKPLRPGPCSVGFDSFFGIPASLDMPPYVFIDNEGVTEAPTARIEDSAMRRNGGGGFWRAGAIAPHFKHVEVLPTITERAAGFVRKQSADRPFFLYLALTGPAHAVDADRGVPRQEQGRLLRRFRRPGGRQRRPSAQGARRRETGREHAAALHQRQRRDTGCRPTSKNGAIAPTTACAARKRTSGTADIACRSWSAGPATFRPAARARS